MLTYYSCIVIKKIIIIIIIRVQIVELPVHKLNINHTINCYNYFSLQLQTYQVSCISRETPAFWSHLPLTRRSTKISRISSTKFGQLILSKMVKIVYHQMSYIKAKMPQIQFRLGLRPRPRWRRYCTPPDLLAGLYGSFL